MTPTMLTDLLKSLSLLSVALLLGTLLRAKLRFLQATFMPASVIGGVILLIAGPQVLGITDRNLINKTIAHEARQRFIKTTLPKVLRFAAIFIAIITVSFGIALAAIPELREYIGKLFMWTTPKYTGISMEPVSPDDNSLPVITKQVLTPETNTTIQPPADSSESLMPEGWTGKYILTNLPDTTVITGYEVGTISIVCYRINPSSPGWDISYNEYPGELYVTVDTEDAVLSTHIINGWNVTAAVKDNLVSLWWNDEDTMFVLQGQHMSLSELMNYMQHLVPVN